jgi:hypothetical protein
MDWIRRATEELGLEKLVAQAIEIQGVQGVLVSVDPIWVAACLVDAGSVEAGGASVIRMWEALRRWGPRPWPWPDRGTFDFVDLPLSFSAGTRFDLAARPPLWEQLGGRENPLEVTISVRPGTEINKLEFGDFAFSVRFETRPAARLARSRTAQVRPVVGGLGIQVSSGRSGTLGGILSDAAGTPLGVTCSHVAAVGDTVFQPNPAQPGAAAGIGVVERTSVLHSAASVRACNPYGGASLNEVDLAVIRLAPGLAVSGNVIGIGQPLAVADRKVLFRGLAVEVSGRECGLRTLVIGKLAVFYDFTDDLGTTYCFRDLFEVNWPSQIALLSGRPLQQGDSGAWVICQGRLGPEWCGMVVGEDRLHGYAFLADSAIGWMKSNHYTPTLP